MSEKPIGERVAVLEIRVDGVEDEVSAMKSELLPAQNTTIKALTAEMRAIQQTLTEKRRDWHWLGWITEKLATPLFLAYIAYVLTHQ